MGDSIDKLVGPARNYFSQGPLSAAARPGAGLSEQRPHKTIRRDTWGWSDPSVTLDNRRIRVENGRWGGLSINPESHASAVQIWQPGRNDAGAGNNLVGNAEERIIVTHRHPFVGELKAPFEIWPYYEFLGIESGNLYDHDVVIDLWPDRPPNPAPRADHVTVGSEVGLAAASSNTLLRLGSPGRMGGRLAVVADGINTTDVDVALYGVIWSNADRLMSSIEIVNVTLDTDDAENVYEWEGRYDGYRLNATPGAATGGDNLCDLYWSLLLRDGNL